MQKKVETSDPRFPMKPFPPEVIEANIARFDKLVGSDEAYLDIRVPGLKRKKFNVIGYGVTEVMGDPNLRPNVAIPAERFNVGMIECENGNGTQGHAHLTEEVFIPLIGKWRLYWLDDGIERSSLLSEFDVASVPIGCYRWFRYEGEGKGRLMTIIGEPAGRVGYLPGQIETAEKTGMKMNPDGSVTILKSAEEQVQA